MTNSNVRIINEMKKYLETAASDPEVRSNYITSSQDFSRKRCLCFRVMVLLILNMLKRSLNVELREFFCHFSISEVSSKQAFSKGRTKLSPLFFHDWNSILISSFYRYCQDNYARWKGFRLLAVDGSCLALPQKEIFKEQYGCSGNQKGAKSPTSRICILYDVLNKLVIKGILHPYFESEDNGALKIIEKEQLEDSLLLFDRGYPSYWLMYQLTKKGTHFLMRARLTTNREVKAFFNSEKTDTVIEIFPPYSSLKRLRDAGVEISKTTPLRIRLVKVVLETGETEVLITNLYESEYYTKEELKHLYHLRWGVETCYGYTKEQLQLGQFSGIRPVCIEQDFAVNLLFFNLQSIIEKQCDSPLETINNKRRYKYKVNKNASWATLKYRVVELFLKSRVPSILKRLEKLFSLYTEPIRPGRKFPRNKKRKPNTKHYTFTNYKRAI